MKKNKKNCKLTPCIAIMPKDRRKRETGKGGGRDGDGECIHLENLTCILQFPTAFSVRLGVVMNDLNLST